MLKCYNCGADIEENVIECPYCHASMYEASEKKYMNDLYSMHDTMDSLDDNALKKELKTTLKRGVIMAAICMVCIIIGTLIGRAQYMSYHDSHSEKQDLISSYNWYDDNIDRINLLYDQGNLDAIYDIYSESDYKEISSLQYWEHYGIFRLYSWNYQSVERYMNGKYEIYSDTTYASVYLNCVNFMVTSAEAKDDTDRYGEFSEEDKQIQELWEENVREYVINVLKVPEEDFDKDIAANSDTLLYDYLHERAAEYYKAFN